MAKRALYPIELTKGLDPMQSQAINSPFLVGSLGAYVREGQLRAVELMENNVSALLPPCSFPFPQQFSFSDVHLICLADAIYEKVNSQNVRVLSDIPVGSTWNAVDRGPFIYLTNGRVAVIKDALTHQYYIADNPNYKAAACMCDFNGQVLLGGPVDN